MFLCFSCFFCVLLTVCVVCFISDILLIYSAVQLPVCLINLLTYLLTYWKSTTWKGRTTKSLKIPGTGIWRTKSLQNFAVWKMAVPRFSLSRSCIFSAARLSNLCVYSLYRYNSTTLHCSAVQTVWLTERQSNFADDERKHYICFELQWYHRFIVKR